MRGDSHPFDQNWLVFESRFRAVRQISIIRLTIDEALNRETKRQGEFLSCRRESISSLSFGNLAPGVCLALFKSDGIR